MSLNSWFSSFPTCFLRERPLLFVPFEMIKFERFVGAQTAGSRDVFRGEGFGSGHPSVGPANRSAIPFFWRLGLSLG